MKQHQNPHSDQAGSKNSHIFHAIPYCLGIIRKQPHNPWSKYKNQWGNHRISDGINDKGGTKASLNAGNVLRSRILSRKCIERAAQRVSHLHPQTLYFHTDPVCHYQRCSIGIYHRLRHSR